MYTEAVNFVHILATTVWLGGAIMLKMVIEPSLKKIDPGQAGKLMGLIAPRFSGIAWTCILLLIITGLIKTPAGMLADTTSDTGIILGLKHLLILGVIVVGILIIAVPVRRMRRLAPAPGTAPSGDFRKAQKLLNRLSMTSTILGVLIVGLASFLW